MTLTAGNRSIFDMTVAIHVELAGNWTVLAAVSRIFSEHKTLLNSIELIMNDSVIATISLAF